MISCLIFIIFLSLVSNGAPVLLPKSVKWKDVHEDGLKEFGTDINGFVDDNLGSGKGNHEVNISETNS